MTSYVKTLDLMTAHQNAISHDLICHYIIRHEVFCHDIISYEGICHISFFLKLSQMIQKLRYTWWMMYFGWCQMCWLYSSRDLEWSRTFLYSLKSNFQKHKTQRNSYNYYIDSHTSLSAGILIPEFPNH